MREGNCWRYFRMLGRALPSTYGPTADTGGLMRDHAPTIYAYANLEALFAGETLGEAQSSVVGTRQSAGHGAACSEITCGGAG
jgi:hypothetical protein